MPQTRKTLGAASALFSALTLSLLVAGAAQAGSHRSAEAKAPPASSYMVERPDPALKNQRQKNSARQQADAHTPGSGSAPRN